MSVWGQECSLFLYFSYYHLKIFIPPAPYYCIAASIMMCFDSLTGNMLNWLFSREVSILWHAGFFFYLHASFEMLKTQNHDWIFTCCIM